MSKRPTWSVWRRAERGFVACVVVAIAVAAHADAAGASPSASVSPSIGLVDGQTVLVSGSGFQAGVPNGIFECGVGAPGAGCDESTFVPAGSSGSFSNVSFSVKQILSTSGGSFDCGAPGADCYLGIDTGPTDFTNVPISFAASGPRFSVSPNSKVINGQTVRVWGNNFVSGAQAGVYECKAGATDTSQCDVAGGVGVGSAGSFAIDFVVHRSITVNGSAFDCGLSAAKCVVAAGTSGSNFAGAPLTFVASPSGCVTPANGTYLGTWSTTNSLGGLGPNVGGSYQADLTFSGASISGSLSVVTGTTGVAVGDPIAGTLTCNTYSLTLASSVTGASFLVLGAFTSNTRLEEAVYGPTPGYPNLETDVIADGVFTPGDASCSGGKACAVAGTVAASASSPSETVVATGTPDHPPGTVHLTYGSGTLTCPNTPATKYPVGTLRDTGFSSKNSLRLTVTLRQVAATTTAGVCFNSTRSFKSHSPATSKPGGGSGLLLTCATTKNVAPCVKSSSQIGTSIVVTFLVPGGDPRFVIVWPTGRQSWVTKGGIATVGGHYFAKLCTQGGRLPVHWKIVSGKLPPGITFDTSTGTMAGTPSTAGSYTAFVQATDSSNPPQKTQRQRVPITVKAAASTH